MHASAFIQCVAYFLRLKNFSITLKTPTLEHFSISLYRSSSLVIGFFRVSAGAFDLLQHKSVTRCADYRSFICTAHVNSISAKSENDCYTFIVLSHENCATRSIRPKTITSILCYLNVNSFHHQNDMRKWIWIFISWMYCMYVIERFEYFKVLWNHR